MDRWAGKVAIVTGASSGIGEAIAKDLVAAGMKVAGLARRKELVEALSTKLSGHPSGGKLYALACDVSQEDDILAAFSWVKQHLGGIDVLVNNAGCSKNTMLISPGNSADIRSVLDVNIWGLVICTREAVLSMKERGVAGHVVHINSIFGHGVPMMTPGETFVNVYPATKHAVTAMTEVLRQELVNEKSKIKVTSISPGVVRTQIFDLYFGSADVAKQFLDSSPTLNPEDISQAVVYALGTPPHVQVHEITIKPVGEPF